MVRPFHLLYLFIMEKNKKVKSDNHSQSNISHENFLSLNNDNYSKNFPVLVIGKDGNLIKSKINFDTANNKILFVTNHNDQILHVNGIDILGYITKDQMDEELLKKYQKNILNLSEDENIALLNFYPKYICRRCNCCGWICCSCRETIVYRKAKVEKYII
jgi:hypothetical protein